MIEVPIAFSLKLYKIYPLDNAAAPLTISESSVVIAA
jgi:hypothetical protein